MNRSVLHRILAFIYIAAVAVSIVIALKAGASIFYYKTTIDNRSIKPDRGHAYRYSLKISPYLFRTQDMLLFEDGHQYAHTDGDTVITTGRAAFSVNEPSSHSVYIYFSASDNTNPLANERKYTLFIPYSFISRPLGAIYVLILSTGLIWFLNFTLTNPDQRKILLGSPSGVLKVIDAFFEHISATFRPDTRSRGEQIVIRSTLWGRLFSSTVLAAFFYIFMEWLFYVTKPSFMSMLSLLEKVEIFVISGLSFSIVCLIVLGIFIVLDLIIIGLHRSRISQYIGAVVPTAILSALALLMIDNFTYTIFSFGISTSAGAWRGAYRFLFALVLIIIYLQMLGFLGLKNKDFPKRDSSKLPVYLSIGLLAISIILALTRLNVKGATSINSQVNSGPTTSLPNIILLGSDGLSAKNMSVYGYERDTTPRLRELAPSSLMAQNAFSNSGNTAGSVVSIMTGKFPTTTRVVDATDILSGANAFQHFPGILKDVGYKTVEYGLPSHVDAYSFNMQNSFDSVNGRSQKDSSLGSIVRKLGYDYPAYFLDSLTWRISERLLHIFYIRDMENPYLLVTKPADKLSDQEKIDKMLSLLDQSEGPVFVHVHLLGTHGPKFSSTTQVFSQGEEQNHSWMVDFYDDAVLSFDQYVGEVIDHLKTTGEYDHTILILYTDHDMHWEIMNRIPLIIHFPNDEYAGKVTINVQNMDIAPTILDYLVLPKPDWMIGDSILDSNLITGKVILGVASINQMIFDSTGKPTHDPALMDPPFYEFGAIYAIDCQNWLVLNLKSLQLSFGVVPGYPTPCKPDNLHSTSEIINQIAQQLSGDGFDVSSFSKITFEEP